MITLAAALVLTLSGEGPFLDLGFDAALAKAKESEKVVFVDFFTTWCGPCKKLDATTWKDEGVQKWLAENTVPLKVDAEKQGQLASRFRITAYPTLLFVEPDGSEKDRIVGYVDAAGFLSQAKDAIAGITALDRARAAYGGHENEPMAREHFADALVAAGRYEEALEHYLWCFDEGESSPSYHGVRLSFLLSDIVQLGAGYPPALEALRSRRDQREQLILGSEVKYGILADYTALNDNLQERERTLATLDALIEQGRCGASAQHLADNVGPLLLEEKRYQDLYELAGRSAKRFEGRVGEYQNLTKTMEEMTEGNEALPNDQVFGILRGRLMTAGGETYEVLLALDKAEEADQVLTACLEIDSSGTTYRSLVGHALSAGKPDAARALADQAQNSLEDKELGKFERWWKTHAPEEE